MILTLRHLPLFFLCCAATSCATLFNSHYRRIEIQTSEPCRIEVVSAETQNSKHKTQNWETQNWQTSDNWVEIQVPRSKSPLVLRVLSADSFARDYRLSSKMSGVVWLDVATAPFAGLGLYGILIDRTSPKFYTYPGSVYVDLVNDRVYRSPHRPPQRGESRWGWMLPTANVLNVDWPDRENRYGEFNWGFSMFYEYYHRNGTALFLKGGFSIEQQYAKSVFVSAGQRHWAGPVQLSYGLGYAKFYRPLYALDYPPPNVLNGIVTREGLGPVLGVGVRLGRHLFFNMDYQSVLLHTGPTAGWGWSSFLAFEVGGRVRLGGK